MPKADAVGTPHLGALVTKFDSNETSSMYVFDRLQGCSWQIGG
jgi:hypothetical protein